MPFMELNATYNNISSTTEKFRYPAFATTGGSTSYGSRWNMGGSGGVQWWRHFSTLNLEEVRCPSFAGDAESTHLNYQIHNSTNAAFTPPPNPLPPEPWSVIGTNYKAMCASHFGCMLNPDTIGGNADLLEPPNGVIVPPRTSSDKGYSIKNILDGSSKTILLAESKEQNISSWYDGCGAWQVATPAGARDQNLILLKNKAQAQEQDQYSPAQPYRGPRTDGSLLPPFWRFEIQGQGKSGLNYGPRIDDKIFYAREGGGMQPNSDAGYADWRWGPSSDHSGGVVLHCWGDAHVSSI